MATNDLDGGSLSPSYVHVAACVGSDVDGESVTIIDRLCLNNAAAVEVSNDLIKSYDKIGQCRESLGSCIVDVDNGSWAIRGISFAAGAELGLIIILALIIKSGLKRTA